MNEKKVPFTGEQLEAIIAHYPTPFHIYDAKGIVENIRRFIKAFSWAKDFKEYFAVKATPNPYIMRLLQKEGVGADCSSLAELVLCEKVGITGSDIIFSSNDTPYEEYAKALEMGAIINLDDITHIAYIEKHNGCLPERLCFRYNPGSLKEGGNTIIGLPEEAKYGMTQDQIIEAVMYCKDHGVSHFGLHTMVVSNELDINGLIGTAELMFDLALLVKEKTGVEVEFIDFGGGIGVAYKPEQTPVDFEALSAGIKKAYEEKIEGNGHSPISLAFECGRMVTGPYGYLVATAIHRKDIYKHYIGLDACMANLMRPALYGSYHHITVMGKEQAPADHVYDVTGSLCENNDKFAIDRQLPKIDIGDRIVIHDAGAHGHAMGFNYNGKLRSAELLLHEDGQVELIRRAETLDDLFATLDFSKL
ncbi:diaminopimelate decarboxylase family protein [Veillonella magna]|uniref:diaminopimelate decarboxylase family protein n=1 Tax=Veillonella magna TaxID=464322 RepID=UPI0023F47C6C|nr:diaminopimelate decarboxylase [Veillonella magna]MBD8975522.1 diaminopimelate decarboxylase [Veillonella magna]